MFQTTNQINIVNRQTLRSHRSIFTSRARAVPAPRRCCSRRRRRRRCRRPRRAAGGRRPARRVAHREAPTSARSLGSTDDGKMENIVSTAKICGLDMILIFVRSIDS